VHNPWFSIRPRQDGAHPRDAPIAFAGGVALSMMAVSLQIVDFSLLTVTLPGSREFLASGGAEPGIQNADFSSSAWNMSIISALFAKWQFFAVLRYVTFARAIQCRWDGHLD
jgi:hypothetical protein